jgi:hypothetical protein
VEKYDIEQGPERRGNGGGGGGEYELQLGFGWTNGVLAKLMAEFPELTARSEHRSVPIPRLHSALVPLNARCSARTLGR